MINTSGLILKLYDGGGYKFSYPSKMYGRVEEQCAPTDTLIAEYVDAAAWGIWWRRLFDKLPDNRKAIILAAYPDLLERDASKLRHPNKIFDSVSTILKKADILKTCPRCGGSGNYSYNHRDGTVCFKCGGFKAIYPRMSKKFIETVAAHFAARKAAQLAEGGKC